MARIEQYRYLGVLMSESNPGVSILVRSCAKIRKLTGMLFRQFSWADTDTLHTLYLTCVRPHFEYASQLWDPYTTKDINLLESVQNFAMKVYNNAVKDGTLAMKKCFRY